MMKTLQQKKDCIIEILSSCQNEFAEQIERLKGISKDEDYDNFLLELLALLAKTHKHLLPEIHLCQSPDGPSEIQKTNIN